MTTFLDSEEIKELTNTTQKAAQIRVLKTMGIEHKIRADGSVVILRAHIDQVFGGLVSSKSKPVKQANPIWDAI